MCLHTWPCTCPPSTLSMSQMYIHDFANNTICWSQEYGSFCLSKKSHWDSFMANTVCLFNHCSWVLHSTLELNKYEIVWITDPLMPCIIDGFRFLFLLALKVKACHIGLPTLWARQVVSLERIKGSNGFSPYMPVSLFLSAENKKTAH